MISEDGKNFIDFCHISTQRFLQNWLDINLEYDEWKKEFPNESVQEFLDIKYPKKEDWDAKEYLRRLQKRNERK